MSGVTAASSDSHAVLSAAGFYILAAIVLVLISVLVVAVALLDHRSDPAQEAADTGLALLDAA